MTSRKQTRRHARESALSVLYSSDITEARIDDIVEGGSYPADEFDFPEYAEQLALGVAEHLEQIDEKIAATSENWALDRMPMVDRAILRLSVYEMLFVDEVPVSVAIDEAVELAKAYGGEDDSPRFVNGVLGRIARSDGDGRAEAAAGEPSGDPARDERDEAADDAAPSDDATTEELAGEHDEEPSGSDDGAPREG